MLVCYLCGQQFGSASLAIHQPQCYQKQLTWWKNNDTATRGPKPKDPAVHGRKSQDPMSQADVQKHNDENFEDFNQNLSRCEGCGRTFLPDRLVVHQRSCKGASPAGRASPSPAKERSSSRSGSEGRQQGQRPTMLVCYLCGQQFGSASLTIHQPQCYQKQLTWWKNNDTATRGPKPKDPATHGPTQQDIASKGSDAFNSEQFQDYKGNLAPCPNCARTFLPDSLKVHMRRYVPAPLPRTPPLSTHTHTHTVAPDLKPEAPAPAAHPATPPPPPAPALSARPAARPDNGPACWCATCAGSSSAAAPWASTSPSATRRSARSGNARTRQAEDRSRGTLRASTRLRC